MQKLTAKSTKSTNPGSQIPAGPPAEEANSKDPVRNDHKVHKLGPTICWINPPQNSGDP